MTGTIHSRVPATILIAIGGLIPAITDSLNRFGATELFQLGKFLGVIFLFVGFLVSIDVFREIRVPFTRIRLATGRRESAAAQAIVAEGARGAPGAGLDATSAARSSVGPEPASAAPSGPPASGRR